MPPRRYALSAAAITALVTVLATASCGMRGGSQATLIDGLPASEQMAGSATIASGGNGQTSGPLIASAPGITPATVHIATIQDISGPVPGLFQTALDGVKAWVAYQNSKGGLDGRRIVLDTFDSGLSPTDFQQAMTKACNQDFALVGVMSTVDGAGAAAGEQCGIPDVADNPTTSQAAAATDEFAAVPSEPNEYPTGWWQWLKQNDPSIVDRAAIMWPDVAITQLTGQRLIDTAQSVGFNFVYQNSVPPVEANFLPYVQSMQSKGVEYFAWQADFPAMARILQSMQQLNWRPRVIDATATAYSKEFLDAAGASADGVDLSLNIGLYEEASSNPAISTLETWLDRAVPGHQPPDIFDIFSWAAGTLLAQAMAQPMSSHGPNPTRAQVISSLNTIHSFTGGGVMAPMDPADRKVSSCFEVVTVKGGHFVRVFPATPDTYDCTLGSLYVNPKIPPASLSGS